MLPTYFKTLKDWENDGILWVDQKANFELDTIFVETDFQSPPCSLFKCTEIIDMTETELDL